MKIFCTGNIKRQTIAYGLDKFYKAITTASLSTGWDFTKHEDIERLKNQIVEYEVFVNSAYVSVDCQLLLTDTVHKKWLEKDIKGHIINIGTTLENTDDKSEYACAKRKLRQHSVKLSDQTGVTGIKVSYIIIGGVNNGTPETETHVKPIQIAEAIDWIVNQKTRIPLLQIDSQKT